MGLFEPGDPQEMLELLRGVGLQLTIDTGVPGYRLFVTPAPVPEWAREVIQANRTMLVAICAGERTGHIWQPCSNCGQGSIVKRNTRRKCRNTPGCEGKHANPAPSNAEGANPLGSRQSRYVTNTRELA